MKKYKTAADDGAESVKSQHTFTGSYLGFVIMAMLMIFTSVLSVLSPIFYSIDNIISIFKQLIPYGLIAIAVVITSRAKGPDISLGAVMTLSGAIAASVFTSSGSVAASVAAALLSAALAGAICGVLTITLRLPSILSSAAVLILLSFIIRLILHGRPLIAAQFSESTQAIVSPGAFIVLPLAIIFAFLFVYHTRLAKPMNARKSGENIHATSLIAYILGGLLAGIAGVYVLSREIGRAHV